MPTISVIVPVYKVEKYINRCVDSILNQTYTDFELILVDDGSLDDCGRICDEYAEKDKRVVVIHQENGGLSAARNAGIDWAFENSNSEWITFIDSDDWVADCYLETLFSLCFKYNCDISVCRSKECFSDNDINNDMNNASFNTLCLKTEEAYVHNDFYLIPAWAKLYRKTLFEDIRFPVGKIHEDRFTTHLALFKTDKIALTYLQLYYYYINENGIMHSEWSPKRLDDIEAAKQQLNYFADNGFYRAYKRTFFEYLILYSDSLYELSNKSISSSLIKKLKKDFSELALRNNKQFFNNSIEKSDFENYAFCFNRISGAYINNEFKIRVKLLFLKRKKALNISYKKDNYLFRTFLPISNKIIKFAYKKISSLKYVTKKLFSKNKIEK